MRRRDGLILLFLGFVTAWIAARGVGSPGYMDADYYFSMGRQWAKGKGTEEPFIWTYLDQPEAIPTASHGYWSPLTSVVIGFSLELFGEGFRAAQLPFIVFTALLPMLVWRLASVMGKDPTLSFQAGLLALAPGFFLPFFVSTDMFSLYALLGALLMIVLRIDGERFRTVKWVGGGVLCGLGHLCRADGFLLLLIPLSLLFQEGTGRARNLSLVGAGYIAIMAAWFYRNLITFGTPLNSAGGQTLWLLSYDEIFSYPASILTPERWWMSGLGEIVRQRGAAGLIILQRILAENGLIFLTPFMVIGMKVQWKQPIVRSALYYLVALFVLMSAIFPFAGARGGWFHSSVAAMPMLWVLAPQGLKASIEWVGKHRAWDLNRARAVFGWAMIILALALTWGLYVVRVMGTDQAIASWDLPQVRYQKIRDALLEIDSVPGVVAINNPPGFYQVSGIHTVALPNGGSAVLEQVVEKYGVAWVIVDANHPRGLSALFDKSDIPPWLEAESSLMIYGETFVLYRVIGE